MSTQQQKILRQQARLKRQGDIPRVADPKETSYFQQRYKYQDIYGKLPQKVIDRLKRLKIVNA